MPKISEIKVSYRRSVQPKQYESAESSVLLNLLFAEGEAPDVDEIITSELERVKGHVERTLGLVKVKSAPSVKDQLAAKAEPAATSAKGSAKPAAATKPTPTKPVAKPAATPAKPVAKPPVPGAKKPPKPAPAAAEPEQLTIVYTKGDAMKAIAEVMTNLAANGITDGPDQIDKLVLAYLPDNKPPFSYNRIPDDSLGDFISDLKKLKV